MTDVLIRNVDDGLLARIDERARTVGQSRQEFLVNLMESEFDGYVSAEVVIGYTQLTQTELGTEYRCPGCGYEREEKKLYLGYMGDLRAFGPVCELCAEN